MDSYSGKKNRSSGSRSTAQQTLHVYEWTSGMQIMRNQLQAGLLRTLACEASLNVTEQQILVLSGTLCHSF